MRVIAGTARGVPLKTVPDLQTRPILDRLKKSLFSILQSAGLLIDARVLDLYAGTGVQGIEALSRGAAYCQFVETRREAGKLLEENLKKTKLAERAEIRMSMVKPELERLNRTLESRGPEQRYDLILYDPPFVFSRESKSRDALRKEFNLIEKLLFPHGRLVWRTEKDVEPDEVVGALNLTRRWSDGKHALYFYGISDASSE